jgi:hypothetical protein
MAVGEIAIRSQWRSWQNMAVWPPSSGRSSARQPPGYADLRQALISVDADSNGIARRSRYNGGSDSRKATKEYLG